MRQTVTNPLDEPNKSKTLHPKRFRQNYSPGGRHPQLLQQLLQPLLLPHLQEGKAEETRNKRRKREEEKEEKGGEEESCRAHQGMVGLPPSLRPLGQAPHTRQLGRGV